MIMIGGSFRLTKKLGLVMCSALVLSACQSSSSTHQELAPEDDAPIFSSKIFGVKASPRVTRLKAVPKGGGRDQIGKPYKVKGKWYYPKEEPGYVKTGKASWYGANFHGRLTANGEVYDMYHLSAAHPTFPLPSYARVTNEETGSSVVVRVNDRGPYVHDRVLDVSSQVAEVLGFKHDGVADVKVEYVGRAPLEGDDTAALMASYRPGNKRPVDDGLPTGVMIASRETPSSTRAMAFTAPRKSTPSLPGVRSSESSIGDLINSYEATQQPAKTPTPSPRDYVLSYAGGTVPNEASSALMQLVGEPSARGESIELGSINDKAIRARLTALATIEGAKIEADMDDTASLRMVLKPGSDGDAILRGVWKAGAGDAFMLRD